MPCSENRNTMSSASLFALRDLDAQLAPLGRYGLVGISSAIVEGLRAFVGVSRSDQLSGCLQR